MSKRSMMASRRTTLAAVRGCAYYTERKFKARAVGARREVGVEAARAGRFGCFEVKDRPCLC